jgi:hypothetical protein
MERIRLLVGTLTLFALLGAAPSHAAMIEATATLTGSQETPPTGSTATGNATVIVDTVANTLMVSETFTGLIGGPAAAAHIHCCAPAGVAAMVAVPLPFPPFPAAPSGTFTDSFDLTLTTTYTSGFLTAIGGTAAAAEATLIAALSSGTAYVNIHNATFPGSEIRGQLHVPEPATVTYLATAPRWSLRRGPKAQ